MTSPRRKPNGVDAIYPLTPLQHGLLVHALEEPDKRRYVEQLACTIDGDLDVDRLEAAWKLVVARHPALRTSFVWRRGERPMQVVHAAVAFAIERSVFDGDVEALLAAERARGVDLAKAPLLRVRVASRVDGRGHVLVWTHHHAILDGWSVARVLGEVLAAYGSRGGGAALPARPFADYVTWLQRRSTHDAERFWRERLSGVTAGTSLLEAVPRVARGPSSGAESRLPTQRSVRLSAEATEALHATMRRAQVTLATLIYGAWAVLLARLGNRARGDDVLFGVTVSGRPAELEGADTLVGLCINTIPFRTTVRRGEPVGALLSRIHRELAETKPHEWTSLVDAHGWSDVPRGAPLFEGIVVVENYPAEDLGERAPPGLVVSAVRVVEETSYPWMLVVGPGRELLLRLDAAPDAIDGPTASALLAHLATLLEAMARAPSDTPVDALPIAPEADRRRIEGAWNATSAPGLADATLLDRVRAVAARHPDRPAARDAEGASVTYAELVDRAEALAALLAARGVGPKARVAVASRRGVRTLAALLAIWRRGAAFVPIDLRHPRARVAAALEDAQASLVVVDEGATTPPGVPSFVLPEVLPARAPAGERADPAARDTAYVLFTSGSTGRPKGVAVQHGSVTNLVESIASTIALAPEDRWLSVTPLTFDIAILELFAPLARGATVAIAGDDEIPDGLALARAVVREAPTVLQATPSTFRMLLAAGLPLPFARARLLAGGEPLNAELARELRAASAELWNVYGPTETTIWSTALRVDAAEAEASGYVAIGRPLANTCAVVLDDADALVGAGLIGELCLAGAGVAEGYVGDEAKTRAAFVPSRWGRLYRTGDRAHWRDDGALVFDGRADAQVKLRGHRVELGEIEAHLEACAGVAQAAVVVVAEQLVAHVVGAVAPEQLRTWLEARVPQIMVPARFVRHDELPRTPNGKIDRRRLATATLAAPASVAGTSGGALSPSEAIVCGALAEVLERASVAPDADFFDLGGHSLLATQVLARLRRAFGVELPIRELFEGRTARALARRVDALRSGGSSARPPLARAEEPWEGRDAPLSFAQARLWFIDQLEPNRAFYNIPAAVRLRGPLDLTRLAEALRGVTQRHATLRTTFRAVDGAPVQHVHADLPIPIETVDLSSLPEAEREREARRRAHAEVKEPFDLGRGPLLRVLVLRLGPEDHVAVLTMHHVASDGWSVGVLIGDLVAFYDRSAPAPLRVQVPDFAVWQRSWLGPDARDGHPLDAQIAYWKERLAGLGPLDLPTDRPRPRHRRFRGARVPFTVEAARAHDLRALARRAGATLFMTLLAAFDVLLARLSGQTDLAVGTPVAGRLEPELEALIGFFANTLVLRTDVSDDPTFVELVGRVRSAALDAHAHQDLPFEQLVAILNPVRDRSRSPLFQAMFVLQNAPRRVLSATGLSFEPAEAEVETSKLDLELTMMEAEDGSLLGSFELDLDLFDVATVEAWARAFTTLLGAAVRDPEERISRMQVLDDADAAKILAASEGPRRPYTTDEGLARALERRADQTPDARAVIDDAGALTYAELDRAKNRLAHALLARGVGKGQTVGVGVKRSRALVASVHACLAIGAPYVPLEPDLPEGRRRALADDARVAVVLTDATDAHVWGARAVVADDAMTDPSLPTSRPDVDVRGSDAAYVLYTSGSTGKPKGVVVEHASLQNRLAWQQEALALDASEAVLHKTPYGFDVSVWELLWPLRVGARLVVAPPGAHRDPDHIVRLIDEHRITTLHFVPSMLAAFASAGGLERLTTLTRIVTSGEALPLDLALRLRARLPRVAIHNLYGPTEAAIDVTHFPVPRGPLEGIPIGRPIANTRTYVVDPRGHLSPIGAVGELWISGAQVARGYLGDEARSREAFGADPFVPGARVYRTGDLARLRHDGLIDFLGRRDGQVKIRGHRVELSEIETALREHAEVAEAAVVLDREGPNGDDARLIAYVAATPPSDDPSAVEHVAGWRTVFDNAYGESSDDANGEIADPTLDLRGWKSSFDGSALPEVEMQAWVDETVRRIAEEEPRRILEIGCGTGLLLFRLAPRCERYVGVDLVEGTLARVDRAARARGLGHVALVPGAAHDLSRVPDEAFDVIVLNSVVQYFPDPRYLVRALEAAAERLSAGGTIFLGDVRSAPLAETLAAAIELARAPGGTPLGNLAHAASQRARDDEELVVDPRFFYVLTRSFGARLRDVRVRLKARGAPRELLSYRYDVTLHIAPANVPDKPHAEPEPEPEPTTLVPWSEIGSLDALRERAAVRGDHALVVTGIPNARVDRDVRAAALLSEVRAGTSPLRTASDLRAMLDRAPRSGFDPDELASSFGAHVTWDLERAGALRLELGRPERPRPSGPLESFASRPARAIRAGAMGRRLREHLRARLPEAMVPSAYVVVERLPLTTSGKLDRARLPRPSEARPRRGFVPPQTELEVEVASAFSEVLGIERVGSQDSFFDLGGHSLLATRLVARLDRRLDRRLELRTIFEAQTVEALAKVLASGAPGGVRDRIAHDDDPVAPLSFAQERLWFLDRLAPGLVTYNVPAAVRIEGALDVAALERSLMGVLRRHAALRVRIEESDGAPSQRALVVADFALPRTDLSGLPADVRHGAALAACAEEARAPFDLERGVLLRARLLRLAADDHVLSITTHHIASDRWSLELLVHELGVHYRHHTSQAEGPAPLVPLSVDYLDYARWQRSDARRGHVEALCERVKRRLVGAPPVLALPIDRPRRAPRSPRGITRSEVLSAQTGLLVEELAREAKTTAFTVFAAAFAALLARFGGGDDIVFGTAVAGRSRPELEPLAGMFVNTIPLRVRVPEGASFASLIGAARDEVLEAFACDDAPFERVVDALAPPRSLGHEPIVQAMLVLQNVPRAPLVLPEARLTLLEASTETSKLDLTLFLEPVLGAPGAYALRVEAAADLFDPETLERLAQGYVRLLTGAVASPDQGIHDVALVGEAERAELLLAGPAPAAPAECVHAIIERRAAESPDAVALAGGSSLGAIVSRARHLAGVLRERSARRGERVAIAVDRGESAVVAILAVLASGAAYVPVPPGTPQVRAAAILSEAAPRIVLTDGPAPWPLPATTQAVDITAVDGDAPAPTWDVPPESLAYLLFTSGSTGTPKGVAVSHRALANHMAWLARAYPIGAEDTVLVRTPLTFDAAVWEPLLPLMTGARMAIAPPGAEADPDALATLVRDAEVTVMQLVPTLLAALADSGVLATMRSLRRIFVGGEALRPELRDAVWRALPHVSLVNLYGPTEATIDVTSHVCHADDGPVVPIGEPIDGARAYVLDDHGRPVPRGAPGELYVGGACLAEGYWNDDAKTRARFVPDPFVAGDRMYRTGDRVRIATDGALVYLGRDDDQVKLGGTRIELGEVESALAAHPDVREAAAVVREDPDTPRRLVGYVVTNEREVPADLKSWLASRLPPAAIPSAIVALAALPKTTSGKIDRSRLPLPPRANPRGRGEAPAGAVELGLARAFAEVLGAEPIAADADFFDLGGDSIASLQVVARARAAGIAIAPRDVFEARSVRALALRARVTQEVSEAHRALGDGSELPLSPSQALVLSLSPADPHHFNQASLVEVPADLDRAALRAATVALVARHEALRLRVVRTDRGPRQRIEPAERAEPIARLATRSVTVDLASLEARADAVQSEMDLEEGPLFRIVHFDLGTARPGRVLLVLHHFIVDTVSWRTLEEDLLSAYAQARGGTAPPRLPLPSASLRDHAAALALAARAPAMAAEARYWDEQRRPCAPLPRDGSAAPTEASTRATTIALDVAETRALTVELRARLRLPVDALLIAPLLSALAEWTGERRFALALESHGRNIGDLDLSRVIGWFTALYPVRFELGAPASVLEIARSCAEALRQVPRGGIGYGLLRDTSPLPEIGWNFLGRQRHAAPAGFAPARESPGPLRSPRALRLFLLEVLASIEDEALRVTFITSRGVHDDATVDRLAARMLAGLRELLVAPSTTTPTPSRPDLDASEAALDERELGRVLKKLRRTR